MQGTNSESTDLADLAQKLGQAQETIEELRSELVQEKEYYSAYYLNLYLKSEKDEVDNANLLKALLAEKATLVEQNSLLWRNIFALLKSIKKK